MRTAAQIREGTFGVAADDFIFRKTADELKLVLIPFLLPELYRFVTGEHLPVKGFVLLRKLVHFLFYSLEIIRCKNLVDIDIVIEPFLDGRPDAEFCSRIEELNCMSHKMAGTVPVNLLALVVLPGQNLHGCIGLYRKPQIQDLIIDFYPKCFAGKAGRNAFSDLQTGRAGRILSAVATGKSKSDHLLHAAAYADVYNEKIGFAPIFSSTECGSYRSRTCDLYHVKVAL